MGLGFGLRFGIGPLATGLHQIRMHPHSPKPVENCIQLLDVSFAPDRSPKEDVPMKPRTVYRQALRHTLQLDKKKGSP